MLSINLWAPSVCLATIPVSQRRQELLEALWDGEAPALTLLQSEAFLSSVLSFARSADRCGSFRLASETRPMRTLESMPPH